MVSQTHTPTLKSPSPLPTQKVYAGGIGGAITVIVIALLQHYTKLVVDPTAAAIFTLVIMFAAGYFTRPTTFDTPAST
jgi:hypothetical protein